ncbi:hypothetical protein CAOG_08217 [Capsaspora owczarzaki ATCC 30864]|uniref:Uncharacterized protein n=1 Tax=Capsaspora owczarzaki (strain ATCC 30864) TaxID=595528 RepID=A0A0D2X5Q5_CAPO3|nr:hypothetical protein CAOG_08217 [Capsaspora owczarzaki ATCC 30864]KJE98219.1 hypothetical protein CAOG_008217 [Capsaspora owczarzaki ATCC 30864]|eukprot:XP_004342472.1 hypothetical protein CAOG_08217 [Capsaspora owczarzaki ATCC 30864]
MFWKFGFHAQSAVEKILDRHVFTLENLLDEEDVLQETKSNNKRLIEYFATPEVLEQLIKYTVNQPDEALDEREQYKYPSLAAEIISAEVWAICDGITQQQSLLETLWNFLDQPAPLNPLLASFFVKVASTLLLKKPAETLEFVQKQPKMLDKLLSHIGTSAIKDLLILIAVAQDQPEKETSLHWLQEERFIERLIELLDAKYSDDVHTNASGVIVEMIQACHDPNFSAPPVELIGMLQEEANIHLLLDVMMTSSSSLIHGLTVILNIVDHDRETPQSVEEPRSGSPTSMEAEAAEGRQALEPARVLSYVIPRIKDLHAMLLDQASLADAQPLKLTSGVLQRPFGATRLKIVRFLAMLFRSSNADAYKALAECKALDTVLDLFFEFQWNNFLHALVEDIIRAIFTPQPSSTERNEFEQLLVAALDQGRVLQRIIDGFSANLLDNGSVLKHNRQGFMGHLTSIANIVSESLKEDRSSIPDVITAETLAAWNAFTEGPLAQLNHLNSRELGGPRPSALDDSDEDDFLEQHMGDDDNTQSAFSHYLIDQQSIEQQHHSAQFNGDDDDDDEHQVYGMQDPFGNVTQYDPDDREPGSLAFNRARPSFGDDDDDDDDDDEEEDEHDEEDEEDDDSEGKSSGDEDESIRIMPPLSPAENDEAEPKMRERARAFSSENVHAISSGEEWSGFEQFKPEPAAATEAPAPSQVLLLDTTPAEDESDDTHVQETVPESEGASLDVGIETLPSHIVLAAAAATSAEEEPAEEEHAEEEHAEEKHAEEAVVEAQEAPVSAESEPVAEQKSWADVVKQPQELASEPVNGAAASNADEEDEPTTSEC